MATLTSGAEVRLALRQRTEIGLLDVRPEGPFADGHPLFAASFPFGRLEAEVADLLPRRSVPLVVYGDGAEAAAAAAGRLQRLGYLDVSLLEGGLAGWVAGGGELFRDVNVPSKAFGELVEATAGSAAGLVRILSAWPCFDDRSRYQELAVPFLKRAQIAAADLSRAGVLDPPDLPRLTMFADNLVPHVLRLDGVLRFNDQLTARIDREKLIEHGSPEEVEIRACAVHAVELIVAAQPAAQPGARRATPAEVDQFLWLRGQEPRYKASPRHRSRCTAY